MTQEMCPSCKRSQEMVTAVSGRIVEVDGTMKLIETISFHCAQCNQFVRSEDHEKEISQDG